MLTNFEIRCQMSIPSPRYISSTNLNPGKDPEDATRKYLFLERDEEKQTEENDNDGKGGRILVHK